MSAENCRVCLGFTHPLDVHGTGCPNAVVDAVETEDKPRCTCGHTESDHQHAISGLCTGFAPSPARDDAEKAIAGLLAEHEWHQPEGYESIWYQSAHRNHQFYYRCAICSGDLDAIASVIAAHMAAPDELTAPYMRRLNEISDARLDELYEAEAERDALRERIRKLADEWGPQSDDGDVRMVIDCANAADALRAALGDA